MFDTIVTFRTAKLAKEVGFDIETDIYFTENGDLFKDINYSSLQSTKPDVYYSACTQSLLQKWLREKHNIISYVIPHIDVSNKIVWINNFDKKLKKDFNLYHESYELALESGLYKALKLVGK